MSSIPCVIRGLLIAASIASNVGLAQQTFEPDSPDWRFAGDQVSVDRAGGRSAIKIRSGAAFLNGVNLENGAIEFDVFMSGERAFVYLMFRGQSDQEYEDLYLRPHKSGLPDALQYSPVFQGRSAWQLYHGKTGTAAAVLPANEWTSVRVELAGPKATVWIGEGDDPVLAIDELGRQPAAGWIAFRGFVPATSPAEYAAYFSNLRVSATDASAPAVRTTATPPDGSVTRWKVSPAFDAAPGPVTAVPESLNGTAWATPPMQANGVFEFLRSRPLPENSRHWAVVAEVTLRSERSQTCAMHLGYSDEITLSLNERLILYQDASYRFDDRRQDGVMHPDQVIAYLPLNEGDNKVRAIIADRFGGWGLSARLQGCEDVEIR